MNVYGIRLRLKAFVSVLVLVAFVTVTASAQNLYWKDYTFDDYAFSIQFPQNPSLEKDSLIISNTFVGISPKWIAQIDASTSNDKQAFSIKVDTYPASINLSDSTIATQNEFLLLYQSLFPNKDAYKLIYRNILNVNGYHGMQFVWRNKTSAFPTLYEVILVHNNVYILTYRSNFDEDIEQLRLNRFPKSLKLHHRSTTKEASFKIDFPRQPLQESSFIEYKGESFKTTQYSNFYDGTRDYAVIEYQIPQSSLDKIISTPSSFNQFCLAQTNNTHGEVSPLEDLEIGKAAAKYIQIKTADAIYDFCFVYDKGRLYQLSYSDRKDRWDDYYTRQFFFSFEAKD